MQIIVSLLAILALVGLSAAQQAAQQEFVHPLTNMPPSSEDVETSFIFPDFKEQRFPLGETVTVLCHFSNDGLTPLNISAIMGSLNHPSNFNYHIQNYTFKQFGVVVKGGEEVTLQYQFQIHPELEVAEYALAHTVFYESDRRGYSTTFFNQTVELLPSNAEADIYTILQLGFAFAFLALVAFLTYLSCSPDKTAEIIGKKARPVRETTWDDDYIIRKSK